MEVFVVVSAAASLFHIFSSSVMLWNLLKLWGEVLEPRGDTRWEVKSDFMSNLQLDVRRFATVLSLLVQNVTEKLLSQTPPPHLIDQSEETSTETSRSFRNQQNQKCTFQQWCLKKKINDLQGDEVYLSLGHKAQIQGCLITLEVSLNLFLEACDPEDFIRLFDNSNVFYRFL